MMQWLKDAMAQSGFRLDSSARPFKIYEYLCIMMDKYAAMEKIRKRIDLAYFNKI